MRRLLTGLVPVLMLSLAPAGTAAPAPTGRDRALATLERLRPLVGERDVADAFGRAAGATPLPARVAPLPGPVPRELAAPLGRLLGAVEDATRLARSAVPAGAPRDRVRRDASGEITRAGTAAVDLDALATAAATVLAAVEGTRPALAEARTPARAAAGCDVLDAAPLLCVGGSGANTHTGDYALQVDLGGDDLYRGSAGGADPMANGLPVSVALDLGGDDRYDTVVGTTTRSVAAQGAAMRGVGILVDVEGDDSYLVRTGPDTDVYDGADGLGTSYQGVGVLADLDGSDRYAVVSTVNGPTESSESGGIRIVFLSPVRGIGVTEGGIGLQLDAGAGDDRYAVDGRPAEVRAGGRLHAGRTLARGFGFGASGIGLAVDDGGTDSAYLGSVAARVTRTPVESFQMALVEGFGWSAAGGTGAVLSGQGATTRTAVASIDVPGGSPDAMLHAFGFGQLGGTGLLHDAGGDDDLRAETTLRARADAGIAGLDAFGVGDGFGTGVLVDAAGADRYTARSVVAARSAAMSSVSSHGATVHGGNQAAGVLLDLAGDDRYVSSSTVSANVDWVGHLAQGAAGEGYGELTDLGGTDRYEAATAVRGKAVYAESGYQGAVRTYLGGGGASFRDAGGTDTFVTPRTDPPCEGVRGSGYWVDCGVSPSTGYVFGNTGVAIGVNT